jgi:iron(III) transport system permease protein
MSAISQLIERFKKLATLKKYLPKFNMELLPAIVTTVIFVVFMSLVLVMFVGSTFFAPSRDEAITFAKIVDVLWGLAGVSIFYNTLVIGIGAGAIGTFIGTIYAWILVRTNAPGKKILRIMAIIPLTMPALVKSIGWVAILSPSIGIVNTFSKEVLGWGVLFDLYTLEGCVFVMGISSLSLSYLLMEPAIQAVSSSLEEAARSTGSSLLHTFLTITLPLLIPGMMSVFLLGSIYSFGNFEYPFVFGSSKGGIDTFATIIFKTVFFNIFPRYDLATIYSIVYAGIAVFMIILYHRLTRDNFKFQTITGKSERYTKHDLGKWKWVGTGICFFFAFIAFILPLIGVLGLALAPNLSVIFEEATLGNFGKFVNMAGIPEATWNTFLISFADGIGVVVLGIFISYTALKSNIVIRGRRINRAADYIATIPLGLPPIVYGVAIFWLILIGPFKHLYGTLWPMIFSLILLKIPHATRMISSALITISDELEEASRISGASWFTTFRAIVVPLLKGGILNAFLFVFIDAVKEVSAVVLLITAGNSVLMTVLLFLYNNAPSALPTIAAGSLIIMVFLLLVVAVQSRFTFDASN